MSQNPFPLSSLEELRSLADRLPGADETAREGAIARQAQLTKPVGSLGILEETACHFAAWQGRINPEIKRAQALVFAGNHGVVAQGISPFPQEVTVQMVANFRTGGAAINQLCRAAGADLEVIEIDGLNPTRDFTVEPAMTPEECLAALNTGAAAVDPEADVLLVGEMGIGNTTIAAALAAGVFGGTGADWVGPGTGLNAEGLIRKAGAVDKGVALHGHLDALGVMAALGGREEAAMAGAVLGARAKGVPVILDGFVCCAAVAPLFGADPRLLDHCLVGHASAEPGHVKLLDKLGKTPMIQIGMRLGEASGAAVALLLVRAALECHNGMATFAEAGVTEA
ncbi:nicotinate-nucleotide--dimethylbenzimidazole phosphoribosyltransferase [Phaeovulum vinaykumarii]|uniref:Nicotinate-nucleotide--dimethylbenzimidazole phosphoribosyltransferase n=1 Tax=Phaeovulum vinaykumarii TaxID=407234 RepID=A0A1N7KC24_9RHOB|nr:nicotinate-nucleotide--dimethylbenzimidazole phosphoribosyltransferase [Phaeovulum vinaykumarii]SIS59122.1 nicotinate-nucleotide-dimethylbenzimidazole phosphoribosyltransferase [Phaeovulum vinaykumarii]SOB94014.1 nicotinate-nucleotide-dimethylbenzimidazole phosphoribosyltransferase [Phaeovulum vinaykumarii]